MTIKEKINYLKRYDVHCLIFGAKEHKYLLNPTISEEQIVAFEQKYSIALPEDYRHFLKTIGNGGAGPGYGLFPLEKGDGECEYQLLKEPFLFEKDIMLDEQDEEFECTRNDCGGCEYSERCYLSDYINGSYTAEYRYQQGSLPICFEGCTFYSRMILNGPHFGEIWAENESEGLKYNKATFIEWYESWLDKSIETIAPFVQAVKERKSFEDILAIPSVGMFHFNYIKAQFVAGMLNMEIPFPGNKGVEKEAYVEKVKEKYKLIILNT